MNTDLIVLVVSSVLNFFIALWVFIRNPKNRLNQVFGLFGVSVIAWTIFNYLADNAPSGNLGFARLTLFFGSSGLLSLFLLSTLFPTPKTKRRAWKFFYLFSAINLLLCLTPLYFSSTAVTDSGAQLEVGSFYYLLPLYVLVSVSWSLWNLLSGNSKRPAVERSQVRLFSIGLAIYVGLAVISNVILPLAVNDWSSSRYGPIFTVPFVAVTSYAVVKHKLFDLRLALTRSVAYIVAVGVVALLYSILVLGVGSRFLLSDTSDSVARSEIFLLLIIPTLFVALTFSHIQSFIARVTRRVFYQDAYDLRTVLDKLSDTLITDSDMDKIMHNSLNVIAEAIKPAYALFVVLDEAGKVYRELTFGQVKTADSTALTTAAQHTRKRILVKDEVASDHWPSQLEERDISVLLRLGEVTKPTGMLFFGPKQNGRIYTKQDIDLLTIGAKNLAVALENAKKYEKISAFADTLRQEVDRATANLRAANQKLKTLDALKDDFISMASHQLRTPASSVHEAIQMLNQDSLSPAERKKLTELAEASSEHLVSVVVDMLSIARIQAGHFNIDKTLNSMTELVKRTLKELSVLVEEKHIKISFKPPKEKTETLVDRAKINEAITNYIENAIKYSPEKTEVQVSLQVKGKRIYFEVIDSGIGVPQAERKNLFTKFYRAKNARTEHPDGNGIGLFVVKTIAESHDGEAYYAPQASGSLFGFWIPIVKK